MEQKKLLMIVNPTAGRNKPRGPLFDAAATLSQAGYLLSIHNTAAPGDAAAAAAASADYDAVVAVGGDGTLNQAVSGLMTLDRPPFLGYIPQGSTNDFATSLHLSSDPAAAAEQIAQGRPQQLDIGSWNGRHFVYVASFGAFTRSSYSAPQAAKNALGHLAYILEGMKDLNSLRPYRVRLTAEASFGAFTRSSYSAPQAAKNALGHLAYILEGMKDLNSLRPYRVRLTADEEVLDGEYLFGAVCNSTSIGGLMKLNPDRVVLDDGKFELLLIPSPRTPSDLQNLVLALLNQQYDREGLVFRHVSSIHLETEEDLPWSLDGEYAPSAPAVDIVNHPQALTLLL